MKDLERPRRPTILSPTRYIHDYHWFPFSALLFIGCLLSFVAGYVNTICIVDAFQLPLTSLTGSTSKMAIVFAQGHYDVALHFFSLVFSFTLGSSISAALVGGSSFRVRRHYGLVLLLESLALALGYLFQDIQVIVYKSLEALTPGAYLVCLACGLQNGMCTTFSGAVIRTTHVTGMLTDIGLVIGQAIFHKRTRKHLWKLKILIPSYGCFCFGGTMGWIAFQHIHDKAILLPCGIIICLGIGHVIYCRLFVKFKRRQLTNENKEIYASKGSSIYMAEFVTEFNDLSEKRSSDTDHIDSDDELNEFDKSTHTQDLMIPLDININDLTTVEQNTK